MRIVVTSLCTLLLSLISACKPAPSNSPAGQAGHAQTGGYAAGKVTFEDGSPITGDVQDYGITI